VRYLTSGIDLEGLSEDITSVLMTVKNRKAAAVRTTIL
jgi:hypothetical protein